jgi:hypothetical protein
MTSSSTKGDEGGEKGLASPSGRACAPDGAEPAAQSQAKGLVPDAKLTANEREALRGLVGTHPTEYFRTFKGVANNCDLPAYLIRRTVRALSRKGLAVYSKGLWTDDGEPAGAGYALTDEGRALAEAFGMEAAYDY